MPAPFPSELTDHIQRSGVIAVLVLDRADDAVPLAHALLEGGVDIMELTLRTPAAIEGLRRIKADVPEMTAGIGTILIPEQVEQVVDAGAVFGVAPGLNPRVVEKAQQIGLPFSPGVATPTDIERAVELGCNLLKFFPAEPLGGLKYLKGMSAPYAHLDLKYVPLGGINQDNLASYLSFPSILAVGGSWIAARPLIQNNDWAQITENARRAVEVVRARS